jgi:hypothetical protein
MSRTFFSLRQRREYFPRHPAPLSTEDVRVVSCPWVRVVPSQQQHLLLWRRRQAVSEKSAKPCGCTVSTMVLSEARGLLLFRVVRGGIGFTQRLGAKAPVRLQAILILTLEPERLKNRLATTKENHRRWKGLFTRDAQAACDFSFAASKFSPFFHRVSVIAAILRASVSRAMAGLMPLASAAW